MWDRVEMLKVIIQFTGMKAYLLSLTHLCDGFAPLETHLGLYLTPHLLLGVRRGIGSQQELDLLDSSC